ncbi:MAG TPA: NUDIX domain-containing protein [Pyrinomonadaceae bacterium]|nr:NUDIX domain-containing protein [Pyrinomonadaceae bacterium]
MQFDEAVQYLLGLGHETLTIKLGLRNTELLLQALDNPEHNYLVVQIAGTNGKGSTAAMLDSICRAAGIRTGLYTSPHLVSMTERIRIAGSDIAPEDFARHSTTVRTVAEDLLARREIEALPTFFEQVTAIALLAFREARVQLAILETGLGGRLDATTAANASIVGITSIAMDHEDYLGDTLASIAAEKAATIRPGVTAVIAQQQPEALAVLLARCDAVGVQPSLAGTPDLTKQIRLGLRGRHQLENASVVIRLAKALRARGFTITDEQIRRGLADVHHPARLELITFTPDFLLDGAHNPAGAQALRNYLDEHEHGPLTLVFGAMRDKKLDQIAETLFPLANCLILTSINNPRAASLETLAPLARRHARGRVIEASSSTIALHTAITETPDNGLICVTGSLYLLGETRPIILQLAKDQIMSTPNDELPKAISSQKVFSGRVFSVTVDTVREGELTYQREVVHHGGSAVIVPVFDDGTVALVRQYRHPAVRYLLEAPAGTLADGERPDAGAERELQEELGLIAGHMEKLSEFFVSPGFCEEKMWVYLATQLVQGQQRLEDDEVLDVVRVPLIEALEMITSGEIQDAKTIIGLMLAAPKVGAPLFATDYPAV